MPSREQVLSAARAVLEPRDEVLEAYLFGSLARGEAQPHSDVDVAVYVDPAAHSESALGIDAEIGAELMRALGSNRVDVVLLNASSPLLYHRVLRDGVRILSRDLRATTTREGRALSRYCDYVPQLAKLRTAHEARRARGEYGR
ncbi:MAG: type VII toxin-antitoxin system MntA family adenylyltransferase antitoxin [Myxococcota bacterium]